MPSIDRPLSGDVLAFDLATEREHVTDPAILDRSKRNARTLLKAGPLRVTLVVVAAGGEIREHIADGPITVQPLDGKVRVHVQDETYEIGAGQLLAIGAGVPHAVDSRDGGTFLLTIASPATS